MRCAAILDATADIDATSRMPDTALIEPGLVHCLGLAHGPDIDRLFAAFQRRFAGLCEPPRWYACYWVGPHTDSILGRYTVGIVYSGGGVLFTGNGRNVGLLGPGRVFVLDNRKQHGLKKHPTETRPMVFLAFDITTEQFLDVLRFAEKMWPSKKRFS
ncbi:hypothetical protein ACSSZE_09480 [Acidithiobacillus caldus]